MKRVLLNEFEEYENMKNRELNIDIGDFSPTALLPLIYNENLNFEGMDSIKKINVNEDNSSEISKI